jgi:hypothetical protein
VSRGKQTRKTTHNLTISPMQAVRISCTCDTFRLKPRVEESAHELKNSCDWLCKRKLARKKKTRTTDGHQTTLQRNPSFCAILANKKPYETIRSRT